MTVPASARFLVTGSTGFIGRRLVRRLVETFGARSVVCLVHRRQTPREAAALASQRAQGVRVIEGDLLDDPVSREQPPPVEVVFHLAANIDTDASEEELLVNHEGTSHLLDWLRPVSPNVRIVYASSVAVHDRDRSPTAPITEDSPLVSRTAYGRTKLLGETILRDRAADGGYSWTTVRLPTVYGPDQKPGGLFDKLITLASKGALLGCIDWPGRTSIIHVDDVAAIMVAMGTSPFAANEVYCLASDESLTVGELARRIATFVGRPIRPIAIPPPVLAGLRTAVWNRAVQQMMPAAARLSFWRLSLIISDGFWFDTTKLRCVYHEPIRSLEDGLTDTIAPLTKP